jgi:hypothetical protein
MEAIMAIPTQDVALLDWSTNANTRFVASGATYNLSAGQVTEYTSRHTAYASALAAVTAARAAGTRSKDLTADKNDAKASLLELAREYYGLIQNALNITDGEKELVGVKVKAQPAPIPAPDSAPEVTAKKVYGHNITLSILDASHQRNGRPLGVSEAILFSFVGPTPPVANDAWQFEAKVTRDEIIVQFDEGLAAGTKVWFTAFWTNPRGLSGPACTPVGSMIGSEGAMPMAA